MMENLRLSLKALFVLSLILFVSMNGFAQNQFETRINESAGDAEENGPTSTTPGEIYFISAINLVYDTLGPKKRGQQTVGLRFTDVEIPQDALILNAYIQFDSWTAATDSTSVYIWTEDSENAPPIADIDYNISSRVKTAGSVAWIDIPDWIGGLEGPDQQTPELASIIQPVVDKTGWIAGNNMCFIIEGFGLRLATSWDLNSDKAPKLVVDFGAKISETVCDSYTSPSGKIWTTSGSHFDTIPNSFGGDSIILVDLTVLESSTSSITETVCDSYTSPSGKVWTVTGTYMDTIPNAAGCDSVITVDLTVNNSSASGISVTACDSYLSPSGKTWTTSGIYMDTIPNAAGCDSVITVDLTVNNTSSSTITETVCDSYISPSGKTWTTTGTHLDTIPNAAGCDSVITVELTVNNSSTSTITETVCGSYTSPSGKIWTTSGTYLDTIPNAIGCDSVITVELTVNSSSASNLTETACDSYTSPSGKTWTTSGIYMDTIPNAAGCDSVITIDLTVSQSSAVEIHDTICNGSSYSFGGTEITETGQYTDSLTNVSGCDSVVVLNLMVHSIDTSITVSGENVLTANETDAQYQWLQDNSIVDGATAQSYTVTETGSYAVVITKNDCVDTSGVYNIQIVTGVSDISFGSHIAVYPNPTKGAVTVDLGAEYQDIYIRLYTISGKLVSINEYKSRREIEYQIDGEQGVYFLHISSGEGKQARIQVMKE